MTFRAITQTTMNLNHTNLIEHFLVPLLKAFRFWHFLFGGMRVEYVVVSFRGRTSPDMSPAVS